jgi:hypothetical protein
VNSPTRLDERGQPLTLAARAIILPMPASTNERQALERERDELAAQLTGYRREIAATGGEHTERRERLAWHIRRAQKRLGEVEARLARADG